MNRNIKLISFFLYLFSLSIIFSQPESQFNPFDWVQYRKTGNINSSSYRFEDIDSLTILYGLGAIKGIGESLVDQVPVRRARLVVQLFGLPFQLCT